jgi:hypothetical protein
MHSSTLVCDRKFGQIWISTERQASDMEEILSGVETALSPHTAGRFEYSIYSVVQLPRNSNECL